MKEYSKISIRWSDFASQICIEVLHHFGVTMSLMQEQSFGPIILREECLFKREIKYEDSITLRVAISKITQNASRFTIVHEFINTDHKQCALVIIDGAWIDTKLRKFKTLSTEMINLLLNDFPKTKDFIITK